MKIFGMVGRSGSGKTTLMVELLPELIGRGLRISTMKHTHHGFDVDKPGKDSHQHRVAGATEVLVTSPDRWALMHEIRDQPEPDMDQLIGHMTPVDLLLIEGFKRHGHPKMEVHRPSTGSAILCRRDDGIVAVASDEPLADVPVPVLDLNRIPAIADFILEHCGLKTDIDDERA
jgi:molybdopterin-guanine dinucleotide biosynthesis adapter protein